MIRNRYPNLLYLRRQNNQRNANQNNVPISNQHLVWEYDYYHYKSQLSDVATTNRDIQQMIDQYNLNPSVYNIRALERMLQTNCKRINQIQNWVSHFPFSKEPPSQVQLQRNLVRHFQSSVLTHINTIFVYRAKLTQLADQLNARDNSFNSLNNSNSFSLNSANRPIHQRGESIKEVSTQIQALNSILRRMGDIVASQGDLINRIDQNLNQGINHVSKGRQQLWQRAQHQSGETSENEFSCSGKINKVIMGLYIANIILIIILVIKNI